MAGGHGGHGHDEGDEIVLHQEPLLGTMLIAGVFAVLVLFGLSIAGNTKFEVITGKTAYNKVQSEKPVLETHATQTHGNDSHSEKQIPMSAPKAQYTTPDGKEHSSETTPAEHMDQEAPPAEGDGHGH